MIKKLPIIFILSLIFVYAGDSYMENWTLANYTFLLSIPALFLALFIRIFIKKNLFIYIILISMILSGISLFLITPFVKAYTPSIEHNFQKPYEYGHYKYYNTIVKDMYIRDIHYLYTDRNRLGLLDDNNTIHILEDELINQKIYIKELDNIQSFVFEYSTLYLISNPKFILYQHHYPNSFTFNMDESIEMINNVLKGRKSIPKLYEHINSNDKQSIKEIYSSHNPTLLLDTHNQRVTFYQNKEFINTTQLTSTPKLALYNRDKDIIYVVYNNQKGLHLLSNTKSKEYNNIQNHLKSIVNRVLVPFWKFSNIPTQQAEKKAVKTLRKYLIDSIKDDLYYKIKEYPKYYKITLQLESKPIKIKVFLEKNRPYKVYKVNLYRGEE